MKKVLIGVAVLAVAAGTAAFLYRDQIGMMIAFGRLKPEMTFAEATPPAAPDYTQPQWWAALPDREDAADVVPSSDVQDIQATVLMSWPAHIASDSDWWDAAKTWLAVGISYAGLDRDRAIQQRR